MSAAAPSEAANVLSAPRTDSTRPDSAAGFRPATGTLEHPEPCDLRVLEEVLHHVVDPLADGDLGFERLADLVRQAFDHGGDEIFPGTKVLVRGRSIHVRPVGDLGDGQRCGTSLSHHRSRRGENRLVVGLAELTRSRWPDPAR
jgi:hypothetical protein